MKRKILTTVAIVMCALLLVAGSIAGTLAYLTSTKTTTNAFTVGNVSITLTDNTKFNGALWEQDKLHLIPGREYTKETYITVDGTSEDCYLFVKLDNGLEDIIDTETLEDQMEENGWTLLPGSTNVYYYEEIANAGDKATLYESMKVVSNVDNDSLDDYADDTIVVTAYAIQAEGFTANNEFVDNAYAAWVAGGFATLQN